MGEEVWGEEVCGQKGGGVGEGGGVGGGTFVGGREEVWGREGGEADTSKCMKWGNKQEIKHLNRCTNQGSIGR